MSSASRGSSICRPSVARLSACALILIPGCSRSDAPGDSSERSLWLCQRHVLQADTPLGDGFAVVVPGDSDLPQLLHAPLDDRLGDNIHPTRAHGAQEGGRLVDANRQLPALENGGRGADTGDAFDEGGVDATMDDAPRSVVLGAEGGVSRHPPATDLIEDHPESLK